MCFLFCRAVPISKALKLGADIVITGRCTDSALALGPLMYAHEWCERDLDKLACGSLAGHLIECGAQATGGVFTDWEDVEGWYVDAGYLLLPTIISEIINTKIIIEVN